MSGTQLVGNRDQRFLVREQCLSSIRALLRSTPGPTKAAEGEIRDFFTMDGRLSTGMTTGSANRSDAAGNTPILVFSPDRDLASSLSMLLEGQFSIVCETRFDDLKARIEETDPSLLLIDLFSLPADIVRMLYVLRDLPRRIPTIVLHVYRLKNQEMEQSINELADLVLYKPIDVEQIGSAVTRILGKRGS